MGKYVLVFAAAYAVLTSVLAWIASVMGTGGATLNIVATIAASFVAAAMFARDHRRELTPEEKSVYARGALVATFLVSLSMVCVVAAFALTPEELSGMWAAFSSGTAIGIALVSLLIVGAIYYLVIRWSFSWYVGRSVR